MKNKFLLLSTSILSMCLCACAENIDLETNAPDYSSSIGEILTFGYASPTNGLYTEDGTTLSTGTDYRTAERYAEYKDAGLNAMLIQRVDPYNGEEFSTSQLKKNMDNCVEAGLSRCIVFDERLYALSETKKTSVVPGLYATQEDLVAYAKSCMKDYSAHPVYYGMMLMDEPSWSNFENYGAVYRAVMEASSQLGVTTYIESNLLPYHTNSSIKARYVEDASAYTQEGSYLKYLEDFVSVTGTDKILMDSYPILYDGATYSILDSHIRGLQLIQSVCSSHDLAFQGVAQTTAFTSNGAMSHGPLNNATLAFQTNLYLGFGATGIGYFTYWRKKENSSTGEWFPDGTSFISQFGEKTDLYYAAKTINEQMQSFAPVITQFTYKGCAVFQTGPTYPTAYLDCVKGDSLSLGPIAMSGGRSLLVTELQNEENGQSMFMAMNAADPDLAKSRSLTLDAHLTFPGYNAVALFHKGTRVNVALEGSGITLTIDPGDAYFAIPYKA